MKIQKIQAILLFLFIILAMQTQAQLLTKEDSLSAGLVGRSNNFSALSGYGEAKINYDLQAKTGNANLTRNVMFFGHKFSNSVYFFSELELENAKVATGTKGEIAMEQFFLKFAINPSNYITTGLFTPRIGLCNENHLPTTFNGNDRPFIEQKVIPSTWREMGISYYGSSQKIRGLNYSAAIFNGLNSKNFAFGSGIRKGRMSGSNAAASNLAVSGALLYYIGNFRLQYSTYYGGSAGMDAIEADSMKLSNGMFGTPVSLNEINMRFSNKLFECKAMLALINIKDAQKINAAYKSNTPEAIYGGYFEAGLHLMPILSKTCKKELTVFSRIESLDLNYKIPSNALSDDYLKQLISVSGITYSPTRGVVIKVDYVFQKTGQYNQTLYKTNPLGPIQKFNKQTQSVNIGFGYSF